MRTRGGWLRGVTVVGLLALGVAGCDGTYGDAASPGGPSNGASDSGTTNDAAASAPDGSAGRDAGAYEPPFSEGIPGGDLGSFDPSSELCFPDLITSACGDATCLSRPACCLGHGDCCAELAAPILPLGIDFEGCEGLSPAACRPGLTAFGARAPWVEGDVLFAGGNADYDSGLVVGSPFDATTYRASISVTFTSAEGCGVSCLESAGLALTEQSTWNANTVVRPAVGLLLGGSDNAVRLLVADRVVATQAMSAPSERWTLVVRPSGEVTVLRNQAPAFGGASFAADVTRLTAARLVLFGRNRDDAALRGAGLSDLAIETQICERPDAFRARTALTLLEPDGQPLPDAEVDAPSVASDGTTTWIAFMHGTTVRLARREADTQFRVVATEFSGFEPHAAGGRRDPALLWDAARGELRLFYTAVDSVGRRSIGSATLAAGENDGFVWSARSFPVLAADAPYRDDVEQPAVAFAPNGVLAMIVRATLTGGGREHQVFRSVDGGETFASISSRLGAITATPGGEGLGADADEVGRPSLAGHDGAWLVHLAVRRGTRSTIVLLGSDELVHFRTHGEVLEGSGAGFDRLSVRAPFLVPSAETLTLYYVGWDGTRSRLGRTTRAAAIGARYSP